MTATSHTEVLVVLLGAVASNAAAAAAIATSPIYLQALAPPTSPPNPGGIQVIYVSPQGTGGAPDPVGLFLTTDEGFSWTQATATGLPTRTQGGYSFQMGVDSASPGDGTNDIIYFGTVG